ncbi:MAG: hypothetical protein J6A01_05320 [Proteobacteria bacterium]|nr:hypothetical protein [Pseudomonadota bacterium]
MKLKTLIGTLVVISLLSLAACNSKPKQPEGDPFLLNAAKNSEQAKQAEAAVNDAAAKVKAQNDAALKQVEEVNTGE